MLTCFAHSCGAPGGLVDWRIRPGATARARWDADAPRRPHVVVFDLLPELGEPGFGAAEHCLLRDAIELRQLVDERILPRVIMRDAFRFNALIRDRAWVRRRIERRTGQCETPRQVVGLREVNRIVDSGGD